MLITVEELLDHPVKFSETFAPGHLDYATEGLGQAAPLVIRGSANLLGDEIEVRGGLHTAMSFTCARCLEPAEQAVDVKFDLIYRPLETVRRGDEFAVPRGEEEIGFYREGSLMLEDVAREQVLLSLPIKTVCREECRGLCPRCGRNRNREECECNPVPVDPRWQKLLS